MWMSENEKPRHRRKRFFDRVTKILIAENHTSKFVLRCFFPFFVRNYFRNNSSFSYTHPFMCLQSGFFSLCVQHCYFSTFDPFIQKHFMNLKRCTREEQKKRWKKYSEYFPPNSLYWHKKKKKFSRNQIKMK